MSPKLGVQYVCLKKFSVGKDAMTVYVDKGDVAVGEEVCGVKMYFVRNRYLTETAFGRYFKEKE